MRLRDNASTADKGIVAFDEPGEFIYLHEVEIANRYPGAVSHLWREPAARTDRDRKIPATIKSVSGNVTTEIASCTEDCDGRHVCGLTSRVHSWTMCHRA